MNKIRKFLKRNDLNSFGDGVFLFRYTRLFGNILQKDTLIRIIRSEAKDGSVIYDIGASHGAYSIYLAAKIKNPTIYAFEPLPDTFKRLSANINSFGKSNRIAKNIIPRNAAVSDRNEKRSFFMSTDSARSSLNQFNAESEDNQIIESFKVDCHTIDKLIESGICLPPDILKIDVEGHEYEVIKGAGNTISKFKPKIFFEPHGTLTGNSDEIVSNEEKIRSFLTRYGYHFKSLGYPVYCYVD